MIEGFLVTQLEKDTLITVICTKTAFWPVSPLSKISKFIVFEFLDIFWKVSSPKITNAITL